MTPRSAGDVVAGRYEIKGEPRQFPGYTGYRAFDREVEVEVALWCIRPELYPSEAARAAFLRAADVARAMKNANARRLFDAGEFEGGLFATVQLAAHQPKSAAPSAADLLERAEALCEALGRAHDDGFVHGRLVPDDVVHVNGLLKIGGIGLWGESSEQARRVWGAAARYVAPEAWSAEGLTPRADVYSAAVLLAELACGGGAAWRQTGDVRELKDELSLARDDVAAELGHALAVDPAKRTESMAALLEALRGALGEEGSVSAPSPAAEDVEPEARAAQEAGGVVTSAPRDVGAIDRVADASARTHDYVKVSAEELAEQPPVIERPPPARREGEALALPLPAGAPSARMPAVAITTSEDMATLPRVAPVAGALPTRRPRPERGLTPYVVAGLIAAVGVALVVWVALASSFGDDGAGDAPASPRAAAADQAKRVSPVPAAEPVVVAPAPVGGPCPAAMVLVEGFCIDAYESPGEGRLPETGMSLGDAERACRERSARLCAPDEWERACRGPRGTSYPYGSSHRRRKCNTDEGGRGVVAAAGSLLECRTDEGIYDMSGNVAEWVIGGRVRGGSALDGTDGRCSRGRRVRDTRGYSDVGFRCCSDAR